MKNKTLDWKSDYVGAVKLGVHMDSNPVLPWQAYRITDAENRLEECTIRNFPRLDLRGMDVVNCRFENCARIQGNDFDRCSFTNCREISIEDGCMDHCEIDSLETLFATNARIIGGTVQNCRCNTEFLFHLEDSYLLGVKYKNVRLTNGAYATECSGSAHVESCMFEDCSTDRVDGRWFHHDWSNTIEADGVTRQNRLLLTMVPIVSQSIERKPRKQFWKK